MYINHMAACFCLVSPLDSEEQPPERVRDGHGRSFGSWPWQKGFFIVLLCVDPPSPLTL